jgi:hypothetical protein
MAIIHHNRSNAKNVLPFEVVWEMPKESSSPMRYLTILE